MVGYMNTRQAATDLQSGRVLAPGEVVEASELDLESVHDAALVADGLLAEVEVEPVVPEPVLSGRELKERAEALEIEGRSKMTADELRAAVEAAEAEAAGDDNNNGGDSR